MGAATLRKAIVVSAIGSRYAALYSKVAPTFEHYAATHQWDIKVLSELPDRFCRRYSRPSWDFRLLCCAYRLQQPSLFPDYDLLAMMDPDMIISPNAPCLSSYRDAIPAGGIAAVQDVAFSERSMFTDWRSHHYSDFMEEEEVARLPFPETHVNAGLMLVRPSEVMDEFSSLLDDDSSLSDEDRVNLRFTQSGRVLLLPTKWNVVYPYELVRRGHHKKESASRSRLVRKVADEWNVRVTQQRLILTLFTDAYVLHFASTDKRIPMHLDTDRLLRAGKTKAG